MKPGMMNLHRHLLLQPNPPSTNGTRPQNNPYTNQANFDTNMVIILAALLCALLSALGLNSIVRCALRCTRNLALAAPASSSARTGLKRSALRKIPVAIYGSGARIPGAGTDCAICLGEFVDGEKVRVLPKCSHGFHVRCIDMWLSSHSNCPTCRGSLLEPPAGIRRPEGGPAGIGGEEVG